MENQGDGVNSQNNHTFQTFADLERYLFSPDDEIDPSINHDQNQEINDQSAQGESDDAPCRKKGRWSSEEDRNLLSLVKKHGPKWAQISREMDGRGRQHCSARWNNHLRPDIKKKKDKWSEDEEMFFIEAHQIFGNRWSEIAKIIPGRSENSIKNHWHATKRKQLSKRKRMNNTEATMLGDYISTKILKETNDPTTATPTTNSTSDDHSNNLEIPLPIEPATLTDELVIE